MHDEYVLHPPTYEWTVRLFSRIRKLLGINLKLHGDSALLAQGEIFLFNHFARTETFLPHYFIHQETGCFCRCIATRVIFEGNEAFRNYLGRVGVLPNDYEDLLPLLVGEIIRGRKVIIFPEGGMVKDRRVIDDKGNFSIYSRKHDTYRKHHTGAAVLAIAVEVFKQAVLNAEEDQDWQRLDEWVEMLELKNREHLLFAAHRPTWIIPGNITFYPINTDENILYQAVNRFGTDLSPIASEELLIEANILLKDTDMDMRLGKAIGVAEYWPWWERRLFAYTASKLRLIEDFFTLKGLNRPWLQQMTRRIVRKNSERLRDRYMQAIYHGVTINLNHLASSILFNLVRNEQFIIKTDRFCLMVYLAVKHIQQLQDVYLHRSLRNPEVYFDLVIGSTKALDDFLSDAARNNLITLAGKEIRLLNKINEEFDIDTIRVENIVQVYVNELAPIKKAVRIIDRAMQEAIVIDVAELARYQHDDELRSYDWNHYYYSKPRFDEVNRSETIAESGRPLFVIPDKPVRETGVLLVHGFLASPAEMKPFSEKLIGEGYPIYAVRLPGHGTSPADLRQRSWEEWRDAVVRAYGILAAHVEQVCVVGFSTGGALSLFLAAENPDKLAALVVINPPMKFRNQNMKLVPLLHSVSTLASRASPLDGVMPYRRNPTEHPRINYHNIPIRGLNELHKMNEALNRMMVNIRCPCLVIHSTNDPAVTSDSADILVKGLSNADVTRLVIDSDRHGILYEDVDDTQARIMDYIQNMSLVPGTRKNQSGQGLTWAG